MWRPPSSGAPRLTLWPHHLPGGSRARPGDCVPPAPIQGREDGADAVSRPKGVHRSPPGAAAGGKLTAHDPGPAEQPCPALQPQLGPSRLLPPLRTPPSGSSPTRPPAACTGSRGPGRPLATPGPAQYRPWEGAGRALGVHEQCRDRVGAAEAWHYRPDLPRATSRDPQPLWEPGRLAAEGTGGPRRLGWSSAKGTAGAGATGWQRGSTGPHLPAGHSRGTGQFPRGAAVGRGLS